MGSQSLRSNISYSHRRGGLSRRCKRVPPVGLHVRVRAYETVHGVFVAHGHEVVEQRVDGGAEVEEHRRHQVEILDEEVEEICVCVVGVGLVEHVVQVVRRHHVVWDDANGGERAMGATCRSYGHDGCCSDPCASTSIVCLHVSVRIILPISIPIRQQITATCASV